MSIRGRCRCGNIEVHWHSIDLSVTPRKCQCQYCLSKNAAYVSKSGTRVDVQIHKENLHNIHQQGTKSAKFHECANCEDLVFVTAQIDGEIYCALNSNCLNNPQGFSPGAKMNLSSQTAEEKLDRWRQNWCHPVLITNQCSSDAVSGAPA
jgi:hypothetical protein